MKGHVGCRSIDPLRQGLRRRFALRAVHRLRPHDCGNRRLGSDERGPAAGRHGLPRRAAQTGALALGARRTSRGARSGRLMRFILPIAVLAAALAALILAPAQSTLFGLDHQSFASAAIGVALLVWLL